MKGLRTKIKILFFLIIAILAILLIEFAMTATAIMEKKLVFNWMGSKQWAT